jgi:excisionase family DNA binding protein
MLPGDKDLLTTEDIAKYLGYHIETIRLYVRQGRLPAIKVGREYRIRREDFEEFLDERRTIPPPE